MWMQLVRSVWSAFSAKILWFFGGRTLAQQRKRYRSRCRPIQIAPTFFSISLKLQACEAVFHMPSSIGCDSSENDRWRAAA